MTQHTSHFLLILLFIVACQCSHFRGGTITWSIPNDEANTVIFTITTYWKPGSDVPADISLNLGDGTIAKYTLVRTTSNSEFVTAVAIAKYTYQTSGQYTVFIGECCRVEGLRAGSTLASVVSATTNNQLPWKLSAKVVVSNVYDASPVLTIPPVVDFGIGANTFTIVSSFPATFQFSLPTESSLGYTSLPAASLFTSGSNPSFTVDRTKTIGVLNWRTTNADIGLWASSVKLTTTTGSVTSDFLIRVSNFGVSTNKPNVIFSGPKRYAIVLGETVSFSVTCSSDVVTSRFNLTTPVLHEGETLNGGTTSVFQTTRTSPVNVVFTPVINNGGKNQHFILTFTCQNTATLSATTQSVVVSVGIPLVLTPPPHTKIDCHPRCGCVDVGVAVATDGCCGGPSVRFKDSVSVGSCGVKFNRTWIAENLCGQSVTIDQEVEIDDRTPPKFEHVPKDETVQCLWEIGEENFAVALAKDTCSQDVAITAFDQRSNGESSCKNVVSRIFTAIDDCDNAVAATQTITVEDTIPPSITPATEEASLHYKCPSEKKKFNALASAWDDCLGEVDFSWADSADLLCGKFVRTFTAIDECGNKASKTFDLEISHTEKPVITLEEPQTLTCKSHVDSFPHPKGLSYCGYPLFPSHPEPEFTHVEKCYKSATRVWTVVDECGISETVSETIELHDDVKPVLVVPKDTFIECVFDPTVEKPYRPELTGGFANGTDNCGEEVKVTYTDSYDAQPCFTTLTRTWKGVDTCGNTVTANQTITIVDHSVPKFNAPAPFTGECDSDLPNSGSIDYTAVGDCHPVKVNSSDSVTILKGGKCEDKIIIRTWTVDDQCGNTATQVQTIVIKNEVPPTTTVPGDTTIECSTSPQSPEDLGLAHGQDKCGNNQTVDVTWVDVPKPNNAGFTRVWTIKDSCGNKKIENQQIEFNNSMPVILCPKNITVPCRASSDVALTGKATASDKCKGTLIPTHHDTESGTCPTVITRLWSVTNPLTGKTDSCVQLITISHPDGPILKVHDDVNVQCEIDAVTFTTTGGACATPFCPEDEVTTPVYHDQYFGTKCNRGRYLTRTWSSNDQCADFTKIPQTINIYDSIKPVLTVPLDVTRTCRLAVSPSQTGTATATDNCDSNPYVFFEDSSVPSATNCPNHVTRTWFARDCTGNFATGEQRITIDESYPVFINTPPTELPPVQCPEHFAYPPLKAIDSCGNPVEVTPRVTRSTSTCPTIFTIKWTATDSCGRTTVFTQTARALDTEKPVINAKDIKDIEVECPSDIPLNGVVSVDDNCDATLTPHFEDTFPPGDCSCDGCAKITHRKWTAVDKCGNKADSVVQVLISRKTQGPTIIAPPDVSFGCDQATTADRTGTGLATATDSCGLSLYVSYKDTVTPGHGGSYQISRKWFTQDNCGRNDTKIQKITVAPGKDSILVTPPQPCNIVCGGDKSVEACGTATVTSTCGSADLLTVVPSMETTCPAEPGVWIRKWQAYRNGVPTSVSADQYIYVEDCKPIGNGILNIPQGQNRLSSGAFTIKAGIVITDLDLPCEVITIQWNWDTTALPSSAPCLGPNCNIQKCDPNVVTEGCTFTVTGNTYSLYATFPKTYTTTGLKHIEALVTDLRSVDIKTNVDDGPTWGRFKARLVLISASNIGASISGDFSLLIARRETEKKRALTGCDSNWIVAGRPTPSGGYDSCQCDGAAGFLFNARLGLGSESDSVFGQLIFSIAQCCSTNNIQFKSTTVEHLSIFSDQMSAVFVGSGTYGDDIPATFSAFVYSNVSPVEQAFYLNVKSMAGVTLINTDPCFPEITDYRVRPATLPLTTVVNDNPEKKPSFIVYNPVALTLSAVEEDTSSARTSAGVIIAIVSSLVVFVIIVAVVLFFALRRSDATPDGNFRQM